MKYGFILIPLICICCFTTKSQTLNNNTGERLSLDNGWRFYLGDIPMPIIKGHGMSYSAAKAGKAWGAAAPEFDDTDWRLINLPHDWAVEQPFDSTANLSQGYRQRGIAWYRRNFKVDPADRGKNIELQFDGIATNCTVWLNGTVVHRNWCGYTSFYIDATAFLKYGEELNNISIRVDAVAQEGWWYEGAGIYRHTWMVKRAPVHIVTDGVYANPIKVNANNWNIPVEVTLENSGKEDAKVDIESTLYDGQGKQVVQANATMGIDVLSQAVAHINLPVTNPTLWWLDNPALYKVETVVKQNGKVTDKLVTNCGFRTIRFDPDLGFFLNDKNLKIKGVCSHQDHAGVGVAVPDAMWNFRLRKLKEMGANAYRCAHNPPSKEFLEACDKLGILVMDENRNFNSSADYMDQLQWMVRRDRNHPSIILWSVFNEEPMQGTEIGYQMVRRMSAEVKKLDKTRPVTAAASGGLFAPINVSQAVDVVGFNYQIGSYDRFHKEHPKMALTSSEDVSGLMTRGEYKNDKKKHLIEAYDTQKPGWGATHRDAWKAIAERPFIAGCFIWTGFDYRGEPQPNYWPTVSSSFGIMDVCGFPKTAFYIHQAQWVDDKPVLQLVPHWNWPADSIGKPIRVMVLTNAQSVKLYLNGKMIIDKPVDKYEMLTVPINYQPGKLEAVGYKGSKEVSRFVIETTGEPASIELIPDRQSMQGDGADAIPVTVRLLDEKGHPVQTANSPVTFEVNGPGSIIGVGNGDANSHEPEKGNKRSLYNGLAQVILQSKANGAGQLKLTATCGHLRSANLSITVNQVNQIPSVAIADPYIVLDKWTVSPVTAIKPNPDQDVADYDQNTWLPIKPGHLQNFTEGNFAVYRTTFKPYAAQRKFGGQIVLKGICGKAEVYIDKILVGTKVTPESADMTVKFLPGQADRKLSILIEAEKGKKAGLGGIVTINPTE